MAKSPTTSKTTAAKKPATAKSTTTKSAAAKPATKAAAPKAAAKPKTTAVKGCGENHGGQGARRAEDRRQDAGSQTRREGDDGRQEARRAHLGRQAQDLRRDPFDGDPVHSAASHDHGYASHTGARAEGCSDARDRGRSGRPGARRFDVVVAQRSGEEGLPRPLRRRDLRQEVSSRLKRQSPGRSNRPGLFHAWSASITPGADPRPGSPSRT